MKTERFESHHEAAQALVLSVAGVMIQIADREFGFADLVLSGSADRAKVKRLVKVPRALELRRSQVKPSHDRCAAEGRSHGYL
jgi:hypothetical protein